LKGFKIQVKSLDFRPGGIFHYSMTGSDGQRMWGRFKYAEISAPEKLEFINSFSDEQANITRAPFSESWPLEFSIPSRSTSGRVGRH
ncbi:MAG: SRPBCC domain-containing protein, partial [Tahibacter sp.]